MKSKPCLAFSSIPQAIKLPRGGIGVMQEYLNEIFNLPLANRSIPSACYKQVSALANGIRAYRVHAKARVSRKNINQLEMWHSLKIAPVADPKEIEFARIRYSRLWNPAVLQLLRYDRDPGESVLKAVSTKGKPL